MLKVFLRVDVVEKLCYNPCCQAAGDSADYFLLAVVQAHYISKRPPLGYFFHKEKTKMKLLKNTINYRLYENNDMLEKIGNALNLRVRREETDIEEAVLIPYNTDIDDDDGKYFSTGDNADYVWLEKGDVSLALSPADFVLEVSIGNELIGRKTINHFSHLKNAIKKIIGMSSSEIKEYLIR